MNNGSLLLLGAGTMQLPPIRAAKEKGLYLIIADGSEKAEGIPFADEFLHIDLKDREKLAEAAIHLKKEKNLKGVFTAGTDFSASVAYAAEKAGLPGIPYEVALNCTDKARMRKVFAENNIPSPDFLYFENNEVDYAEVEKLGFPLVVKPVDNMGGRGIRRIDNIDDLKKSVNEAFEFSRTSKVIVERYMSGKEYSIDSLVYNGEITICGIADRHIFFPPYFIEMGHTIPCDDFPEYDELIRVFKSAVKALGIENGAAKGDVKLSPEGPMIGEIAARLSGGYMSGWTYPFSSGVNLSSAGIDIAMGNPPSGLEPVKEHFSAERAFLSIPGTVKKVNNFKEASETPLVEASFLRVKPGDKVSFPVNNVEKCGNIISEADKKETAINASENAVRKIIIELDENDPETSEFIFSDKYSWAPDAFAFENSENIAFFKELENSGPAFSVQPVIKELPFPDKETSRDWHGLEFKKAFELVSSMRSDVVFLKDKAADSNDYFFWKSFIRGGVQGALWYIDKLIPGINKAKSIKEKCIG